MKSLKFQRIDADVTDTFKEEDLRKMREGETDRHSDRSVP